MYIEIYDLETNKYIITVDIYQVWISKNRFFFLLKKDMKEFKMRYSNAFPFWYS